MSGIVYLTNGQVRPGTGGDSTTAFRFQNAAGTTTVLTIDTTNWRVGVGDTPSTTFEVQGTASASYFLTSNTIQVGGAFASVAWSRFGSGTAGHTVDINASNDVYITGALEVDGTAFFDGTASVASNFEVTGYASASQGFFTTDIIVGGKVASSSSTYTAEFGGNAGTATVSLLFGSSTASSKGTCLQMKDQDGEWVYLRVSGETGVTSSMSLVINNTRCQ